MRWSWPWRRNDPAVSPLRQLGWDVHSHLVPGVDDGAQDLVAALDMVRGMVALGYRGMVLTPHIMADLYPNSRETLIPAFESLLKAVQDARIPMEMQLAAEYLLDVECLKSVQQNDVMTFDCLDDTGTMRRMLLLEFGFHHSPDTSLVKEMLFESQTQGLTPLLAHCERYPYLHRNETLLETWHQSGGWMSVNAASLAGAYGPETKQMAKRCMERDWVSFLCSDAHGMRHIRALESLAKSNTVQAWLSKGHSRHVGLGH